MSVTPCTGLLRFLCLSVVLTQTAAYPQEVTPETKPSAMVTAKIPPPYHDPYTYVSTDPLLKSTMSGSLYRNDFFGFSYTLPQSWTAVDAQIIIKRNKGATVRAEPLGSSLTAQTVRVMGPVILLLATPIDAASGARLELPYANISMYPSGPDPLSAESIRGSLKDGDGIRQRLGIASLSGPVETEISGHTFFRTDFNETRNGALILKTFFSTSVHGGTLRIEFCAGSKTELDQIITTVQSISFVSQPASAGSATPKP
ncbi:MAG TPA: hypothetical protein VLX32_04705 [Candidatus Acidoferrum sp.]|nr:hypothetical protein [Candidatus Acidoferrum sp.]